MGKGEQGNQFRCTVFEGIQGAAEQQRRLGCDLEAGKKKKKNGLLTVRSVRESQVRLACWLACLLAVLAAPTKDKLNRCMH